MQAKQITATTYFAGLRGSSLRFPPKLGTSDEFQIEEAMISSSSAECADDGMH